MSAERLRFTRREALKLTAAGAVCLSAARLSPLEVLATCETEREPNRHILVVDFAPYECNPRFAQEVPYNDADLIAHLAINSSVPPEKRWLPNLIYSVASSIGSAETTTGESVRDNVPLLGPFEQFLKDRQDHGEIVADVLGNALAANGYNDRVLLHPIQQLYEYIRSDQDEEGNRILFAGMNTQKFIESLYLYPESNIVNLSWQVGEVGIKTVQDEYGLPEIEVLGAYRKEAALTNLTELAKIGSAHKDKLFLCASGNFGDQLGDAKATLVSQGIWPTNILTIAEASPGTMELTPFLHFPFSASGADIAIDSRNKEYNPRKHIGSTVATALGTYVAHNYEQKFQLKTPEAIIEVMKKHSQTVSRDDGTSEMLLLDPDSV